MSSDATPSVLVTTEPKSGDEASARRLCEALCGHGVRATFAPRRSGESIAKMLVAADAADAVVVGARGAVLRRADGTECRLHGGMGVLRSHGGRWQAIRDDLDSMQVGADDLKPGPFAYLEVSDTGCGMDEETLQRVFDPFFTTKFTGRGLGMSAVLGIVRGHQGAIRVYSEPGRGTTMKMLLPTVEAQADALPDQPGPTDTWRSEGTVLLADDEKTVLSVGRRMLQRLGFDVLTADDGAGAVASFLAAIAPGVEQREARGESEP